MGRGGGRHRGGGGREKRARSPTADGGGDDAIGTDNHGRGGRRSGRGGEGRSRDEEADRAVASRRVEAHRGSRPTGATGKPAHFTAKSLDELIENTLALRPNDAPTDRRRVAPCSLRVFVVRPDAIASMELFENDDTIRGVSGIGRARSQLHYVWSDTTVRELFDGVVRAAALPSFLTHASSSPTSSSSNARGGALVNPLTADGRSIDFGIVKEELLGSPMAQRNGVDCWLVYPPSPATGDIIRREKPRKKLIATITLAGPVSQGNDDVSMGELCADMVGGNRNGKRALQSGDIVVFSPCPESPQPPAAIASD